jgi:hypothetical protein
MKNFYLLSFIFYLNFVFGQEKEFYFTKDGLTDFVVIECPDKSKEDIYKKVLDWISVTYKNPKEVLKASLDNDYIRFEGSSPNLIVHYSLLKYEYNGRYTVEVSVKDGKFKFDVIALGYYHPGGSGYPGREIDILNSPMSDFFKKDGRPRATFKDYPIKFKTLFDGLTKDLKNFIMSDKIPSQKNEW